METIKMLRIIFNDLVECGMTTIPEKLLENITLENNLSDMLPTDTDIINLFKNVSIDAGYDNNSLLFTEEYAKLLNKKVTILDYFNEGDGNLMTLLIQYTTKTNQKIIIKYEGIYSSWDSCSWHSMGYVPEIEPYIAYKYPAYDTISI